MKWWLVLLALPVHAHVMSISTGEAIVNGNRLEYVLRMPAYEIVHMAHPETALLEQVHFEGGRLQHQQCFNDKEDYVCAADYLFDRPITKLDISCTLYRVTVPNHVHVLHAQLGDRKDQAFFDYTFTNSIIRFEPPGSAGIALRQLAEGGYRAVGGAIQILFLISLALAARTRRELAALTAAFLVGLVAGALMNWHPAPRFAECAAALSIAYLAVEILFLPQGHQRWLVALALGAFQGIYLGQTGYFLTGAAVAGALACGAFGLLIIGRVPRRAAYLPLAAGLVWFFARLFT